MDNNFNSGFIAIIGRPNVGKSTFMNQMIGQKIAVMSDKAQTTRNKIQGVRTEEHSQIVFIDTPGIHKPKHRLGDFMVQTAEDTLNEVDAVLFLIDAKAGYGRGDQYIIDRLQQVKKPVFLILNKIDLIEKENLLLLMDSYKEKYNFTEIIPVSALEGENVHYLLQVLKTHLPEGPQYYPEDQITDHPERFIMEELLREKVLQLTHEEIPHSIAVTIDHLEKRASNAVYVQAVVIAERSSQKGILIGKNGSMLKEIGKRAREEMESLLGTNVYLDVWVKIQKDWRNRQNQLRALGFREEEY